MVNGLHTKDVHFLLEVASDATHAQDAEDFAPGVVAEGWGRGALEGALAEVQQRGVEVAERAEDQEGGCVGCGIVGDLGHVGE